MGFLRYNTRNVSPFFYLTIAEKCQHPKELERDFLVLEMETRLSKSEMSDEFGKKGETRCMRESMKTAPDQSLLPLLTKIATKTKENDNFFNSIILNKCICFFTFPKQKNVDSLTVIDFFYKNRGAFLERKVDKWLLTDNRLNEANKPEYANLLLEHDYKNEKGLLHDFTRDSVKNHSIFSK